MRNKEKKLAWLVAAFLLAVGLCLGSYVYVSRDNYRSALAATKEWARLSDFPALAEDITVTTTGNIFTRGFIVTFTAPLDAINGWLAASAGTAGVDPVVAGSVRRYRIEPGGCAQYAEVEVDDKDGSVKIEVYWS